MNPTIFCAVVLFVGGSLAQNLPSYLSRNFQYPRPFIGFNTDSTVSAGPDNRFGGASSTSTVLPPPIDEYGHNVQLKEFAQRIPEGHKPFWYLNRDQIRRHLGLGPISGSQPNQPNQSNQSTQPAQPIQTTQPSRTNQPFRGTQPSSPRPDIPAQTMQQIEDIVEPIDVQPINDTPDSSVNVA